MAARASAQLPPSSIAAFDFMAFSPDSTRSQTFFQRRGRAGGHTGYGGEVGYRCFADGVDGPELLQKRTLALWPDARNLVQRRAESSTPAACSVIGDGEAMSFIPNALQQEQPGT